MTLVLLPHIYFLNEESITFSSVSHYKWKYLTYLIAIWFCLAYEKGEKKKKSDNYQPSVCQ